jgi:hypothetical protein
MSRSRTASATLARLRARGPQPREERALLGRRPAARREPVREEGEEHVEVAARPDLARQLAHHAAGAPAPPTVGLAREEGQGHGQAPAGHPDLVDRLGVAGQSPGQLGEDTADPVAEEQRGAAFGRGRGRSSCRGRHLNLTRIQ